jgi:hypothetical protein
MSYIGCMEIRRFNRYKNTRQVFSKYGKNYHQLDGWVRSDISRHLGIVVCGRGNNAIGSHGELKMIPFVDNFLK